MGPEPWGDEPGDEADPFEGLDLDEDFVRAAPVREPTAADRARAARQESLSRLLSEHTDRRRTFDLDAAVFGLEPDEPPERPRTRRRTLQVLAIVLVVALVLVYVVADLVRSRPSGSAARSAGAAGAAAEPARGTGSRSGAAESAEDGAEDVDGDVDLHLSRHLDTKRPKGWPPEPIRISDEPLGRPGPVPAGGGPHAFSLLREDGVTPVGYDPCRPISYVTRPGTIPRADELVSEAIGMVSTATGLQFVDEGRSDEPPTENRSSYQPDRYGERWAPVLVAWSDERESPRLGRSLPDDPSADVAGYASSRSAGFSTTDPATGRSVQGGQALVSGSIVLDEEDLAAMLEGPDGWARARAVVAHELAHLVGLSHVDDPAQLMYPAARPSVTGFGPGDLQGLARLGSLECFPQI